YLNLTPQNPEVFKMRQVAVAPEAQGKGVGAKLVSASEQLARQLGARRIALHARETAVPFYLKLNYQIEGEPFEEVGIPHRYMVKELRA
ncbi:MAG: GNAT family N-acetyltransferase, partial [Saprospiraceae bacterium]